MPSNNEIGLCESFVDDFEDFDIVFLCFFFSDLFYWLYAFALTLILFEIVDVAIIITANTFHALMCIININWIHVDSLSLLSISVSIANFSSFYTFLCRTKPVSQQTIITIFTFATNKLIKLMVTLKSGLNVLLYNKQSLCMYFGN